MKAPFIVQRELKTRAEVGGTGRWVSEGSTNLINLGKLKVKIKKTVA